MENLEEKSISQNSVEIKNSILSKLKVMQTIKQPDGLAEIRRLVATLPAKDQLIFETFIEDKCKEQINTWVGSWSVTSADNNPTAIAIQKAAQEEFGLLKTATHIKYKDAGVDEIYNRYGTAMKSFLRAQYDETQDFLKDYDTISLYRGMYYEKKDIAKTGNLISDFDNTVKNIDISLQPISSFSTNPDIAVEFSDTGAYQVVIKSDIPKERILSTCQTGFGCKIESEMVVLGGEEQVSAILIAPDGSIGNAINRFSGGK